MGAVVEKRLRSPFQSQGLDEFGQDCPGGHGQKPACLIWHGGYVREVRVRTAERYRHVLQVTPGMRRAAMTGVLVGGNSLRGRRGMKPANSFREEELDEEHQNHPGKQQN